VFVAGAEREPAIYAALFTLMTDHGPRPGEAIRLPFTGIDWRHGTVRIWATKTYRERTVTLSARSLRLLRRIHADAKRHALAAGAPVRQLAFVNARGEPIDQSRLTKRMKRILERAGLPTTHGLYDLRHSFVTRGLEAGRPPTEIAAEIGDRVETVLRFYAHPAATQRSEKRATRLQHATEKS
jgi:site-specific recombinase XerD